METNGEKVQPLLINAEYLKGTPKMSVDLDGVEIFRETLEKGNYVFEAPMPTVNNPIKSKYQIFDNGKLIDKGFVARSK